MRSVIRDRERFDKMHQSRVRVVVMAIDKPKTYRCNDSYPYMLE